MRRIDMPVVIVGALGLLLGGVAGPVPVTGAEEPADAKSPTQQVIDLETSCAATAEDRAKRQAETPLFERLGGEEKIHALTREVLRLHRENEEIGHYFAKSDPEVAAKRAAAFIISGTGGPPVYDGPDLRTTHERMRLSNRDFVVAGQDIVRAMKNLGHGLNEVDEVICTLVSLRDQVVREDQIALRD